jgi:tetratricopeptide (TPR) repeat protein
VDILASQVTHYRVFIASPAGLEEERVAFNEILRRFNDREGNSRGINFNPVGWEATLSQQGRPQSVINEEVRSCDFFLLMMHDRWGTRPGEGTFTSGTQEELAVARECLIDEAHPLRIIAIMFKLVSERQLADPGPELSKVLDFKKTLEREKTFLYTTYDDLSVFKETLERHLAQWARMHDPNSLLKSRSKPSHLNESTSEKAKEERRSIIDSQIHAADLLYSGGKIVEAELAYSAVVVKYDDAFALAKFGRFLRKTGSRHRATEVLTRALELAKSACDQATEAYASRQFGQLLERSGAIQRALAQYGHALQTYFSIGDLDGQARTHRDLALAHRKEGDYRRSLEHLENSRALYEELGDENGIAAALGYEGVLYKSQGNLAAARAANLKAVTVQSGRGDPRGKAAAQSNLAIVLRMLGEYEEAKHLHEQALEIYQQLHDRQGESRELSNLGTLRRSLGDYDAAIVFHLRALAIAEHLQNKHGIAIQYGNLARNYLHIGRPEHAEKLHLDALDLSKALDDVEGQSWQHDGLGHVAWKRGNLVAAAGRFDVARAGFSKLGAKYGEALSSQSLGNVLLDLGRRAEALTHLTMARDLFRSQGLASQSDEVDSLLRANPPDFGPPASSQR